MKVTENISFDSLKEFIQFVNVKLYQEEFGNEELILRIAAWIDVHFPLSQEVI